MSKDLKVQKSTKEIIGMQLLAALDDKSKVALVLDEEDLNLIIGCLSKGMEFFEEHRKEIFELLVNLSKLKREAFGS